MIATSIKTEPLSVLIVEDEPRLRDLLSRVIPDMGFACTAVRTGEEALRIIEHDEYQIVLLDLNLPGMSGLEFLRQLRPRNPETAVIILTGYGDLESARQAIHLDVVDFLTKPCPLGELEIALDRARKHLRPPPGPDANGPFDAEPTNSAASIGALPPDQVNQQNTLEEIERRHILASLQRHEGNRTAVAAELGISLRTLYYRIAEYQKQGLIE